MALIDQVIPFQRKILADLVVWETRIGELYGTYARLYPKSRVMWQAMQSEERQHAAMLESLQKELDQGHILWNLGKFQEDAVASQVAIVKKALNRVLSETLCEAEIVQASMEIENSILESRFYSTVSSDSPAYVHIAAALNNATVHHVQRLKNLIRDHAGDRDWTL